jgi:hypothetical protein
MDRKPSALTTTAGSSNGASDPAKLRADIAETRNEMSGTIEQLHGRLNPVVLKEQALEQFHEATETIKKELKERLQDAKETLLAELKDVKETVRVDVIEEIDTVKSRLNEEVVQAKAAVREATIGKVENMMQGARDRVRVTSRSVKDVVSDNPIPAALAGVGLAWLLLEGRRRRESRGREAVSSERLRIPETAAAAGSQRGDEDKSFGRQIRDVGQQTGQKVADAAHEAVSAVSTVAEGAKETVSDIAQRAQGKASELSHGAGEQARRVQRRSSEVYRSNPIAVGAALLAAGTIVGLVVPRTTTENEWLGGARDNVVGKAQELAHQAFGKAGEAVKRIAEDKSQGESSASDRGDDDFH